MNDFSWAVVVLSAFPRAMLIMAGAFGLWRAGLISNALFAAGVAGVVLGVLGGTTWLSGGFWAPDGGYSRFVFAQSAYRVGVDDESHPSDTKSRDARRMVMNNAKVEYTAVVLMTVYVNDADLVGSSR